MHSHTSSYILMRHHASHTFTYILLLSREECMCRRMNGMDGWEHVSPRCHPSNGSQLTM